MATTCKLIAKQTLGSNASTVTFSNIPGSPYTDLLLVMSLRSSRTGDIWDVARIRFNGANSDTNHSTRFLQGNGSSAISSTAGFLSVGTIPSANATSSTFSVQEIYIANYAGSAAKSVSISSCMETNGATSYIDAGAGLWNDSAAITSLTIDSANFANLVTNCTAYLYGITKS